MMCMCLALQAGFLQTAAADGITYSILAESGRPAHFYEDVTAPREQYKRTCDTLLGELNRPWPLKSYDMKPILLGTSRAIDWNTEVVSQERRRLGGKVRTATLRPPESRNSIELLLLTEDVRDAPVDTLVIFPHPTINLLRLTDGRIDAAALVPILASRKNDLSPPREWMREHYAHTDDGATPFDDSYYWSEVVIVDEQAYIMMASPPQYDDKEYLVGYLDVFVAPLDEHGLGDLACHFVHKPENSR